MKSKQAIIKDWFKNNKTCQHMVAFKRKHEIENGLTPTPISNAEIKECYVEEFGNILGECVCCQKLSHDRHGQQHCVKDWVARGFTCDYADAKNKVTFCSIECASKMGVEFSIRPLLNKPKN